MLPLQLAVYCHPEDLVPVFAPAVEFARLASAQVHFVLSAVLEYKPMCLDRDS